MISNYLKVAFRNLRKYKAFTFINVAGLAIGMACCLLILLYVQDEIRYDRYHEKSDRIHRVTLHGRLAGNEVHVTSTCVPMAAALIDEFPEVETAARLYQSSRKVLIGRGEKRFNEERVFFTDSTYFDIFSHTLIKGDIKTALSKPNSLVLTEETAVKYFGSENPVGQTLTFNNDTDYLITAVAKNVPEHSHFHFDFLASFNSLPWSNGNRWISNNLITYLVLKENTPAAQLEEKLPHLVRKYVAPQIQQVMGGYIGRIY